MLGQQPSKHRQWLQSSTTSPYTHQIHCHRLAWRTPQRLNLRILHGRGHLFGFYLRPVFRLTPESSGFPLASRLSSTVSALYFGRTPLSNTLLVVSLVSFRSYINTQEVEPSSAIVAGTSDSVDTFFDDEPQDDSTPISRRESQDEEGLSQIIHSQNLKHCTTQVSALRDQWYEH